MIATKTFSAEFSQDGVVLVREGQTLLDAALAAGVPIMHECGGNASCSTCRVLVMEGAEHLSAPTEAELELKAELNFPPNTRLACQTRVSGNAPRLSRIIRDESDIDLYIRPDGESNTQLLGGEKEMALFFLDIRNFTVFLETHPAFDAIHIVRKLWTAFHKVIERNHGRVIETAGDSIYAVFGLSDPLDKSAPSAVRSGLEILRELERLNKNYFSIYYDKEISIGIGIHEGLAIGGSIKMGRENHLVIMGYPVNIASRLQDATKELNNNFIISEEVYRLLPEPLPAHETSTIHLRGVTQSFQVHLIGNAYE